MSTEPTFDPSKTPLELSSSLTQLETALSPLLAKEWSVQMEGMDPLGRAKMDVMMAYTIVDLIWVYLKMKGVDPASHEVSPELERVRTYYTKLRAFENPDTRKYKVDVPAASRFIASGIPQNQRLPIPIPLPVDLPETSAAGAAAAGRRRAAEEAEQASLERLGKAERMRFVKDEAERVIPGLEAESGMVEDEEEDQVDGTHQRFEEEDEPRAEEEDFEMLPEVSGDEFEVLNGPPTLVRGDSDQVEDLFMEVQAGLTQSKRKRAEEF